MNRNETPMPKFGRTALEVLDGRNAEPHSLSSYYSLRLVFAISGASFILISNWAQKRPRLAGGWRYIPASIAGYGVGEVILHYRQQFLAERDAVLRHYVKLHPEDFKPKERIKFGQLFIRWDPVR